MARGVHGSPMEVDLPMLHEATGQALLRLTGAPHEAPPLSDAVCGQGSCSDCCEGEAYSPQLSDACA